MARLAEEIRKDVAVAIDGTEGVFFIGSKPVKVCQNSRAKRCAMGRDNVDAAPDRGILSRARVALLWGLRHTQCHTFL